MNTLKSIVITSLSILSVTAFAQKQISVTQTKQPMQGDSQRVSFATIIPQTNLKEATKNWQKYISEKAKGKMVLVSGDNLQTGVVNKNISVNPFDVYSKLRETNDGVLLSVWFPQNSALFTAKEQLTGVNQGMDKYIRDFAVLEYKRVVQRELKVEQDKLKKLEADFARLIQSEEKSIKTVNENDRSTLRANQAVTTNNADIENSATKISNQKENVDRNAGDANASKGARKTLTELENDKRDLQRKNETQGRNTDNRDKENRAQERYQLNSKEKQSSKTEAIEKQRLVVASVQAKLNNII
jgi:hypothetical protein